MYSTYELQANTAKIHLQVSTSCTPYVQVVPASTCQNPLLKLVSSIWVYRYPSTLTPWLAQYSCRVRTCTVVRRHWPHWATRGWSSTGCCCRPYCTRCPPYVACADHRWRRSNDGILPTTCSQKDKASAGVLIQSVCLVYYVIGNQTLRIYIWLTYTTYMYVHVYYIQLHKPVHAWFTWHTQL